MNRSRRHLSFLAAAAVLVGGVWSAAWSQPVAAEPQVLSGAVLEWSVSDEANAGSFNGQCNFMSAGESDGLSGTYRATDRDVTVTKLDAAGTHVPISSYAERCMNGQGVRVTASGSARLGQKVVLSNGTGLVDPATGEVEIRWSGTFTVNYYGNLTPFWITDPVLTVDAAGDGTLVATVGGYASSIDNPDVREKIQDRHGVEIASLRGVSSANIDGFVTTPLYDGVVYDGDPPQMRAFPGWGSWPLPFVDVMTDLGLGAYWYTSGGAADARKAPDPVAVTYGTGAPVTTTTVPNTSVSTSSTPPTSSAQNSTGPTPTLPVTAVPTSLVPTPAARTSGPPTSAPALTASSTTGRGTGWAGRSPTSVDVPGDADTAPGPDIGGPGDRPAPDDAFSWTVDAGIGGVDLGQVTGDPGEYRFVGRLGSVTIADTRTETPAWSLSGQASDFTGGIPGSYLGWVPRIISPGAGAYPGDTIVSGLVAGDGLGVPALLAAAPAGHERGSATVDADLELRIPDTTPGGGHVTTLTLTALG